MQSNNLCEPFSCCWPSGNKKSSDVIRSEKMEVACEGLPCFHVDTVGKNAT